MPRCRSATSHWTSPMPHCSSPSANKPAWCYTHGRRKNFANSMSAFENCNVDRQRPGWAQVGHQRRGFGRRFWPRPRRPPTGAEEQKRSFYRSRNAACAYIFAKGSKTAEVSGEQKETFLRLMFGVSIISHSTRQKLQSITMAGVIFAVLAGLATIAIGRPLKYGVGDGILTGIGVGAFE